MTTPCCRLNIYSLLNRNSSYSIFTPIKNYFFNQLFPSEPQEHTYCCKQSPPRMYVCWTESESSDRRWMRHLQPDNHLKTEAVVSPTATQTTSGRAEHMTDGSLVKHNTLAFASQLRCRLIVLLHTDGCDSWGLESLTKTIWTCSVCVRITNGHFAIRFIWSKKLVYHKELNKECCLNECCQ